MAKKTQSKEITKTSASPAIKKNKKSIYITKEGLVEAQEEFNYLKKTRRLEIANRIQRAREFGDLSENSEYDAAMDEQAMVENRIAQLEDILKSVQVISDAATKTDFVVIGSTVSVEMEGDIDEFTIVGRVEADPSKKKISNESPLGEALLGAKAGETVEVTTPIVRYKCKVLEIK